MDEFPYYELSWFFYLLVAAMFLLFCAWHSRNWSSWARIPILTFIAALALTPGVTISGESWWSPAAIIMIFEIDRNGLAGISRNGISIIAVWLLFMVAALFFKWKAFKWLIFNVQGFSINKKHNNKQKDDIELIDPEQ